MIPLAAYADRLSVRGGETINFHVSNATATKVAARVVRVTSADANPKGPGIKTEPVAGATFAPVSVATHPLERGSYAVVDIGAALQSARGCIISATVWPTRLGHAPQPILSWLDPKSGTGVCLQIGTDRRLQLVVGQGNGKASTFCCETLIDERQWVSVYADVLASGSVTLSVSQLGKRDGEPEPELKLATPRAASTGTKLCIGASPEASFNGKIERPKLDLVAADGAIIPYVWNFAEDMASSRIVDTGPQGRHGTLVNQPTRAVTGSNWNGREMCWRHAPDQYGAIHFHDDDIDDCQWPVAFSWAVPADLRSGCYALLLQAADEAENIPFFVPPPRGKKTADLAVLVSTYTYTVYGNHARPEWQRDPAWRQAWIEQTKAWGGYPHNSGQHTDLGLSTYNFHSDGSGIAHASWRRPMLNLRIGYLTYPYPEIRASGLRHYPADMHLVTWLEQKGIAYDIITDAELDAEGTTLLGRYRCVITGSHPEYHTPAMMDALEHYRDSGGRLMYMGGNGFYWKIALNPERPGAVEIRRAEGGIRAWAAETGEYYNQFDGEYGGLWRRNGRPPQKLAGVGFTAQGNFVGSHYRIKSDARASRVGWMLDGIDGDTFGGSGLSGHGAAGFELDRADKRLGTPAHAVILAASEGHKPDAPWVLVPEEQLTHIVTWAGEPAEKLIRADIVFFEAPNDGAVFSTGSITFCGSLLTDAGASRLTETVLRRFLDSAARFPRPDVA
jgi:N,N-dimethylformamidase